jgi:iduronate 2-sulfatase
MGYSLRTERYRYTMWGENAAEGEELYDYESDPHEAKTLAQSASSADLKSKLRDSLERISRSRKASGV